MSLVLSGSSSGTITLDTPAVAGTQTATLPAATGTVMVSGNMPAFSAYASAAQSLTSNVFTKVALNAENFDTASAFDSTTNYRFTPQVAGYYQINAGVNFAFTTGIAFCEIYKNGANYKTGNVCAGNTATAVLSTVSSIVYFNGSTDYIEIYVYQNAGTQNCGTGIANTYFNGAMVRAA